MVVFRGTSEACPMSTNIQTSSSKISVLYPLRVTGTRLADNQISKVKDLLIDMQALDDYLTSAIDTARVNGIFKFSPTADWLTYPSSLDVASIFNILDNAIPDEKRLRDGTYADLTLRDWSDLVIRMRSQMAKLRSSLPPGNGGGIEYSDGKWYINGESFTLSDGFLGVRTANYSNIDATLGTKISQHSVNLSYARKMVELISDMSVKHAISVHAGVKHKSKDDLEKLLTKNQLTLDNLVSLEVSVPTGGIFATTQKKIDEEKKKATPESAADVSVEISKDDYVDMITVAKSIFDNLNSKSQIEQLGMDSLLNQRKNILEGMSSYIKSEFDLQSKIIKYIK